MVIYRWRGVSPRGKHQSGVADWPDLAAEVETMFKRGWRSLIVCTGGGPVPPPATGPAGLVAAIGPHPGTGRRTWWAEEETKAAAKLCCARPMRAAADTEIMADPQDVPLTRPTSGAELTRAAAAAATDESGDSGLRARASRSARGRRR